MFGYVVIDKPNILIKDYQTYRSYYCGLCKAIGKNSGTLMRFSLNYDIVLLALLGHNYEETEPEFIDGRCVVHPFGKKLNYVKRNSILDKITDINTLLGYYKLVDDVIDEGKHRAVKNMFAPKYKKAKKRMPEFDKALSTGYERLRKEEKDNAPLRVLAEAFGIMLSASGDALTDKCDKLLREFLFYIGQWVYVIDAFDDIKKDDKEHNFNPFLSKYKGEDGMIDIDGADREARSVCFDCIDRVIECYNKMKITVSEGPLSNIVYKGLAQRTEFVLSKRGEKWQKIRL